MRGGARPGAGNPGYGKTIAVRQGVEKLTPRYFELLEVMINGEEKDERKFAMSELSKLMGKMIPTELTGPEGEGLQIGVIVLPAKQAMSADTLETTTETSGSVS